MSTSVTIQVQLATGRHGQKRLAEGESPAPPPERVPRVARLLALAHHWNDLIRDGTVHDRASLSRLVGVSRARVSQVMRLLDLAPDIQEAVLDGGDTHGWTERQLRECARRPTWRAQIESLREIAPGGLPFGATVHIGRGAPHDRLRRSAV